MSERESEHHVVLVVEPWDTSGRVPSTRWECECGAHGVWLSDLQRAEMGAAVHVADPDHYWRDYERGLEKFDEIHTPASWEKIDSITAAPLVADSSLMTPATRSFDPLGDLVLSAVHRFAVWLERKTRR